MIGIVDTGIDYMNPLLKYEDKTKRIAYLWDQSLEGEGTGRFDYGQVFDENDLNQAIRAEDPYSIVPSIDEVGHGTFLAGVGAGYDRSSSARYTGAAPDATLVVVKLRPAKQYLRDYYLIENGAIAYQNNDYLAGISYLINMARKEGKPIAICTGLGGNDGAHAGDSVVGRYLDDVSTYENVVLVLSAGNEANQGHHYTNTIKQGETQTFEVNVAEKEKGFILNFWNYRPDFTNISFTTPLGQRVDKIQMSIGGTQEFKFPLEPTKITVEYIYPDLSTGGENIQVRLESPTPGIWQFQVYGESIVYGVYDVWLPREGFVLNNTRFLKPESYTTVCMPATSVEPIVVGAYNGIDQSVYAASGRGPTRAMVVKPDLVAPGVNVEGPSLNNEYMRYTGTSVAAAVTTGACVLLLQWAVSDENLQRINTRVAKTILVRGATRQSKESYPNNITGYGQLDLKASLMYM